MRKILTLVLIVILFSCNKHEEIQKQINASIQAGIEKESEQPGEAVRLYLKALDNSRTSDTEIIRQCHTNLAIVYQSCELFQEAEVHYLLALDVVRESVQKVKLLRNLGLLYQKWGNYSKSEEYYQAALKLDKEYGKMVLNDLGVVSELQQNYQEALEYYQQAKRTDGVDLFNIGRMQVKLGRLEVGLENIEKGISILKNSTDTPNLSAALIARVEALVILKRTDEAKDALVEAETTSRKLTGMPRKNLLEIYQLAQDLHGQSGYLLYKQKAEEVQHDLDMLQESGRAARFRDQSLIRKAEADRAALLYRAEKTHKRLIALFAATTLIALLALALQYWRVRQKHLFDRKLVAAINQKRVKKDSDLFDI